MLKALAENQNEMADRVNYLTGAVESLSAKSDKIAEAVKKLAATKTKSKGDKK